MGAGARLIQRGDRRSIRGPSLDRPVPPALLRRACAAVAGAAPVGGVSAFQVERAVDMSPQNDSLGEIGGTHGQLLKQARRDVIFDVVPVLRSGGEFVGQEADHLEGVFACRRAAWIDDSRRDGKKYRVIEINSA